MRWTPKTEASQFIVRVWRRLIENGVRVVEIARTWGVTRNFIYQATPGHAGRQRREIRQFRARVWSRLVAAPFKLKQTELAEIWGISTAKVCREISTIRYHTPRLVSCAP